MTADPETIVSALRAEFPDLEAKVDAAKLEQVMAAFSPISSEVEFAVEQLISPDDRPEICYELSSWHEADTVVNGEESDEKQRRIQFLLMDTCTCVLQHLPYTAVRAVQNNKEIHPTIARLAARSMVLKKNHGDLRAAIEE